MTLDNTFRHAEVLAKVSSRAYPSLERVPGKQNWVDRAGGLPKYIERIAKHLHYERGMSIGRAIATAVSKCRKWALGGDGVHADTQAKAAKAVAEWEMKKRKGRVAKSNSGSNSGSDFVSTSSAPSVEGWDMQTDDYIYEVSQVIKAKAMRHVRDVEFWGLPYGTPLTPANLAQKRKEGFSDRDIFNSTRPSDSKRRLKSQPETRSEPLDQPDALAEMFGGVDRAKKKTPKKSSTPSTKGKTTEQIVEEAEARAKKRVAAAKRKAEAEAKKAKETPEVAEEVSPSTGEPKAEEKKKPARKKTSLTDEEKEMLLVLRDVGDNSDERWTLEIKSSKDPKYLREIGGKIDSGRYGDNREALLELVRDRIWELKG